MACPHELAIVSTLILAICLGFLIFRIQIILRTIFKFVSDLSKSPFKLPSTLNFSHSSKTNWAKGLTVSLCVRKMRFHIISIPPSFLSFGQYLTPRGPMSHLIWYICIFSISERCITNIFFLIKNIAGNVCRKPKRVVSHILFPCNGMQEPEYVRTIPSMYTLEVYLWWEMLIFNQS